VIRETIVPLVRFDESKESTVWRALYHMPLGGQAEHARIAVLYFYHQHSLLFLCVMLISFLLEISTEMAGGARAIHCVGECCSFA